MSRDIVGSLEQLGLVSSIGMGLVLHSDDEPESTAPAKIDLAFRTRDLKRCFPQSARVLFDSDGAVSIDDINIDPEVVVVEEFTPSLRVFSEAAGVKTAAFKKLLVEDVHFDTIKGPVQGVTRTRLHRLNQSISGDFKILVILVIFEGLSNVDVSQYDLLKPEATMIGRFTTDLLPPAIRFTIVHIPIRDVYELAIQLHGQLQRKIALDSAQQSDARQTTTTAASAC